MSTQLPPQGDQTNPTTGAPAQSGKPAKPFYKKAWFIILAIIVVIGIFAAASGGEDEDATASSTATGDSNSSDDSSTNDDAASDGPAAIGDTVSIGKGDVTATNLRNTGVDALGESHLCIDINVVNTSDDDSISLNGLMDWKLTDPNGVTSDMDFTTDTDYDSVEVGPGGQKSGVVCFKSDGAPGDYRIIFEEGMSFTSDKAEWTATL